MRIATPLKGLLGWTFYRLWASYWSLAVLAAIAAVPVSLAVLYFDRHGLTDWLIAQDLSPVATADTAKDFAGVASGISAAFITLYFSITLIVLSMAAGNLGVRLIDRWLGKTLIRVSLGGLSFSLVVCLIAMLAVDGESPLDQVPLALIALSMILQVVNVSMLSVSLHALGRTMFVDTSIDALFRDASGREIDLIPGDRFDGPWGETVRAERDGYVNGLDMEHLASIIPDNAGRICVLASPGRHVMRGEPILLAQNALHDTSGLHNAIALGDYRSDSQGVVFRIRLLVEIAARALSPAVNDFYTALTCADRLVAVMADQTNTWIDADKVALAADRPRFALQGRDFRSLFEDPIHAFRQAACEYPSVSIRMIDNFARLVRHLNREQTPRELGEFIQGLASTLNEHAQLKADVQEDKDDIAAAYLAFQAAFAGAEERYDQ